jgi:hypothetical protein
MTPHVTPRLDNRSHDRTVSSSFRCRGRKRPWTPRPRPQMPDLDIMSRKRLTGTGRVLNHAGDRSWRTALVRQSGPDPEET